jgi:integrase
MPKKARSSGEGTVRTRADGTGEARLLIPKEMRPRLGGRTYLYFYGPTEADAREKRDQAKADLVKDGPGALEPSTVTVGEWLERWLAGPLKRTVSESTYQDYEYRSHTYLIPAIGDVKLKDLTAEHLDMLYEDLSSGEASPSGKPLSATTVGHVHATIRVALQRAVKKRVVPYNVARDAEPPKATRREYPTLSKGQLVAFFKAAAETEDRFEALFIVWTLAGPRPGELLGLRWSDLRLPEAPGEPGELILRRSWSASRKGAYMRETTKTGKGRPVYLLPEAVAALKAHRLRYLNEKMRYREIWNAAWQKDPRYEDLVFPSTAGTPMSHNNLNRRHLKPLLERAGVPPMRPYDLRHTFATLWLESGESVKILQEILGHSRITLTLDTYAHVTPHMQREAFGRFGQGFSSSS